MLIDAFNADLSVGRWIVSTVGCTGIAYVMFSGARQLEIRRDKRCGHNPNESGGLMSQEA